MFCKYCDIITEKRAVTWLWHSKQLISVAMNTHTQQKNRRKWCFLCGPCRGYILRNSYRLSCEIGTSQRGPEPWDMEAEESMMLGAITRRRLVKTQQTEKT
jgi:hypothetical protein